MDEQVLESERIYVHGVLDSSTEWFGTGKLWSQTQYKNGKRHGIHKVYSKDGKTIDYIQYYESGESIKEWDSVSSMKKDSTIQ
jgi:antitoxin component YwqK of YwqJK toxin-antitoxin module